MGLLQSDAHSERHERDLRVRASALVMSMSPSSVALLRGSLQLVHDQARHPLLLHPLSPLKAAWDLLGALCVVYYSWMVPMMLAFDWYEPSLATKRFMLALDVWAVLDVALRFRTGVIEDGAVVMHPPTIARAYLRSAWLPVDLLASVPFDVFLGDASGTPASPKTLLAVKYFKLPRLLRIPRLVKHVRQYKRYSSFTFAIHAILFSAHAAACIWVALLHPCSDQSSTSAEDTSAYCGSGVNGMLRAYLIAFEHGVVSLLGVSDAHVEWSGRFLQAGFGLARDGTATRIADGAYMWSTVVSVLGSVLSAALVGTIIGISKSWNRAENAFRKQTDRIKHEMDALCLPKRLRSRVTAYYDYLWLNNRAFSDELSLLQDQGMSLALREQIAIYLFKDYLLKIPFFQLASDAVLGMICMQLRQVIYMPDDFIIREGDIGKELFMIVKGVVRVMPPKDEAATPLPGPSSSLPSPSSVPGSVAGMETTGCVTATIATATGMDTKSSPPPTQPKKILLGEGDFFGEIGVVMEVQRTRSVRAESMAELCILSRDGFNKIMVEFPEFAAAMKRLIVKRVSEMWKEGGGKEQIDKMTALADQKMKKAAQTYRNMDKLRVKTRALQTMYPRLAVHGDELSLSKSEFEVLEEREADADAAIAVWTDHEEEADALPTITEEEADALPTITEADDDDSAHRDHSFHAYPTADWHPREWSHHDYDDQTPLRTLTRPGGSSPSVRPPAAHHEREQLRELSDCVDKWAIRLGERVGELEAAVDKLFACISCQPAAV